MARAVTKRAGQFHTRAIAPGGPALLWTSVAVLRWVVPVLAASWVMALSAGVAQGGFVFAPEASPSSRRN